MNETFAQKLAPLIEPHVAWVNAQIAEKPSRNGYTLVKIVAAWEAYKKGTISEDDLKFKVEQLHKALQSQIDRKTYKNYFNSTGKWWSTEAGIFSALGMPFTPASTSEEEENEDDLIASLNGGDSDKYKPLRTLGDKTLGTGVYLRTFPCITDGRVKIGKFTGTASERVDAQINASKTAIPQKPTILLEIYHKDFENMERLVHRVLRARAKKCPDSVGDEWFFTTPEEVTPIIEFVYESPLS